MAHAQKTKIAVTQETDGIILTLTEREAVVLKKVTQHIGGNPNNTARKESEDIHDALAEGLAAIGHRTFVEDDEVAVSGHLEMLPR